MSNEISKKRKCDTETKKSSETKKLSEKESTKSEEKKETTNTKKTKIYYLFMSEWTTSDFFEDLFDLLKSEKRVATQCTDEEIHQFVALRKCAFMHKHFFVDNQIIFD